MSVSLTGPVPVSDTSPMFLPAALAGHAHSVDLAVRGYVEEEYFVHGQARLFDPDESGRPTPRSQSTTGYTTRIIVRRPDDPSRASSIAHVEVLNPSAHFDLAYTWPAAWPALLDAGHTWVGVTCKPSAVASLRRFSTTRYRDLVFDDVGLVWDLLAELGLLLGSGAATWPGAERIEHVIASGWSQTGSILRTFLAEGFAAAAARPGRQPFDGYLIGISSGAYEFGYTPLNSEVGPELVDAAARARRRTIPELDPRRVVQPHGVAVIEWLAESEALVNWLSRRPDSDHHVDRYRGYEVAGRGHRSVSVEAAQQIGHQQMTEVGFERPVHPGIAPTRTTVSDHETCWLVRGVVDALGEWVRTGTPPPRADPLVIDARVGRALSDELGTALGGVRTPFLDVPLAGYHSVTPDEPLSDGPITAWEAVPISASQALARYGSRAGYLAEFTAALDRAIEARWYRSADRSEILAAAAELAARVFGEHALAPGASGVGGPGSHVMGQFGTASNSQAD